MKKALISFIFVIFVLAAKGQDSPVDTLSLLFIGDIMGHDSQINAAWNDSTEQYNYDAVFQQISPIFKQNDFAIANLEVTLAGEPYKGYPRFSSPDELAVAAHNSGINVLMTANNHACDRGKSGILRTINVLDSLEISHTGTFKDQQERDTTNLLILHKNNIKVGLLNYTYGTNGLPVPSPTIVNKIDTLQIAADILKSKSDSLDKLIVVIHWGKEYKSYPSSNQRDLALFLLNQGVDVIIGSHPHVIQPMEYYPATTVSQEQMVVYSLGNFISNQRKRKTDGGAMVQITLTKSKGQTKITDKGYYLTWVNKPVVNEARKFEIVACKEYENTKSDSLDEGSAKQMKLFIDDSRKLLQTENIGVDELEVILKQN